MSRDEVIKSATLRAIHGKSNRLKAAIEKITSSLCKYEMKTEEGFVCFLLENQDALGEILAGLRHTAAERDRFPNGLRIIEAYKSCPSFPPPFKELKRVFIALHGEETWNGGKYDDRSAGDWSARDTLKGLGLPIKELKPGRPIGAKSQPGGPLGVKEGYR